MVTADRVRIEERPGPRWVLHLDHDDPLSDYLLWVARNGVRERPLQERAPAVLDQYRDPAARKRLEARVTESLIERMHNCGLLPLSRLVVRWHLARDRYGTPLPRNFLGVRDVTLPVSAMPLVSTVTRFAPTDWCIVEGTVAVTLAPPEDHPATEDLTVWPG